jgi:hypothetical protein
MAASEEGTVGKVGDRERLQGCVYGERQGGGLEEGMLILGFEGCIGVLQGRKKKTNLKTLFLPGHDWIHMYLRDRQR